YKILPGENSYYCPEHQQSFQGENNTEVKSSLSSPVDVADSEVIENRNFRYSVFTPKGAVKTEKVIMMFHGLNEKYWHKYLPWAYRLCLLTGKAVVLFPIAFHMNRAPHIWSDSRKMYALSSERKQQFPYIIDSTLTNVAISTRLQTKPQRYLWSGLQTYHDVIDFITGVHKGNHSFISDNATFDIFAYSIGSFLSQILMMANHDKLFEASRLFIFCGGSTFNRYSPVTKFILDSEADVELYSYVVEHLESHLKQDKRLGHFLGNDHLEGICFRSMLNYKILKDFREGIFRNLSNRIAAIGLAQDTVIPPYEMMYTLKGSSLDIPIRVDALDFEYQYKHEDPFQPVAKYDDLLMKSYTTVFDRVAAFLQ
ncbi:MAG: DUF6051 family protein, partial [Bacteroidota bacterium]|nr:DUF6051 family protein [Bacteroidota bacterium]